MEFACRSSKDNTEGVFTEGHEERRPLKMSSKDLVLSKKYATRRKLELDQDLVFLLVSLSFY